MRSSNRRIMSHEVTSVREYIIAALRTRPNRSQRLKKNRRISKTKENFQFVSCLKIKLKFQLRKQMLVWIGMTSDARRQTVFLVLLSLEIIHSVIRTHANASLCQQLWLQQVERVSFVCTFWSMRDRIWKCAAARRERRTVLKCIVKSVAVYSPGLCNEFGEEECHALEFRISNVDGCRRLHAIRHFTCDLHSNANFSERIKYRNVQNRVVKTPVQSHCFAFEWNFVQHYYG